MKPPKSPHTIYRSVLAQVGLAIAAVSLATAQQAPAPAATTPTDRPGAAPVPVTTVAAPSQPSDDVVSLNPFEITSTNNRGYYATNSMSGTRFNARLEDLASAISVVTKEQMADFAMLDINDIFAYTGNAEGTRTYSATTTDRNGSISDDVQLNPQGANRIRGIAPANISLNNIETMGRVPIDPINLDAVEISRGPNANVFGLGNPSGTVNQVAAAANLTRDRAAVQFRADSYGGYRSSLDVNRVLLKNKLAVRGSAVFQHDGYIRKPSGTNTERFNGMIRYQPFQNTTISASVSFYRMNGNRPNALTPRDDITYWIQNGRPTWDPTTQQVHINGVTVGTYTAAAYNGPDYFSGTQLGSTNSQLFIDQNGLGLWSAPQAFNNVGALLPGTTVRGPTAGGQADRFVQTTGIAGSLTATAVRSTFQPLFNTSPAVSDKSIYDWNSINLAAPNRLVDRTITSNVQLDQIILNTPMQTLAAQFAFMREDSQRYTRNLLGIQNDLGQSGQLQIDPNEKLLDGTPNPWFLHPFMGTARPRIVQAPQKWDTYRAQAAYKLDLTAEKNLLKWLGVQQITAYDEYKYRINRQYSFRDAMLDQKAWISPGTYVGNNTNINGTPTVLPITQGFYRYYVGDGQGNNVDYAPHEFNNNGTYNFVWGRAAAGTLPAVWNSEPTRMGLAATTDSSGISTTNGAGQAVHNKVVLKTVGTVLQSHFLNDALVVTLGTREDKFYNQNGYGINNPSVLLNPDGQTFNYPAINAWDGNWTQDIGKTTNVQFAVRPFRDLPCLKRLDEGSGVGRFFASALRGFSVYYNKSNSFIPQPPGQDLYFNRLPDTTGTDKSFGFGLNLFDGKIAVRVTHYDTAQFAARSTDMNTLTGRVIRTDLPYQGSGTATKFQLLEIAGGTSTPDFTQSTTFGPNLNQGGWIATMNPTWTPAQIKAEFIRQTGLTEQEINIMSQVSIAPTISGTADTQARGTEYEVNLNPTRYWTVSANFTDSQSILRNVSSAAARWIAQRMPIWTTLVDQAAAITWTPAQLAAEPQHLWWTHNYGGTQTAQQNFRRLRANTAFHHSTARRHGESPDLPLLVQGKHELPALRHHRSPYPEKLQRRRRRALAVRGRDRFLRRPRCQRGLPDPGCAQTNLVEGPILLRRAHRLSHETVVQQGPGHVSTQRAERPRKRRPAPEDRRLSERSGEQLPHH
jgi:hypothetical protein